MDGVRCRYLSEQVLYSLCGRIITWHPLPGPVSELILLPDLLEKVAVGFVFDGDRDRLHEDSLHAQIQSVKLLLNGG